MYPGNFVYKLSPGALEALASHLNEKNTIEHVGSLTARSKASNETDSDEGYISQANCDLSGFQVVFNQSASF